ncbi:MAG: amidohydrolase family protein [Myxococcota bacterium]|nr:amidohydrolase family protein [Myxococcota bacterium]
MLDRLIKGGTVVDGTGGPARKADVGIRDGLIACVGEVTEAAREEIDATGLLVTPGWVDVHTHYDGQVSWDPGLTPSSWHGVTTVVMGNCGVGFAPAEPSRRDWLIGLMEGVEDIPGTALAEGIRWDWETFPEYLDAIERAPHAIDIGAQLPHGALRAYVMGERGSDHTQLPSPEEIAEMGRLAREAVAAGALGFSSSRTRNHRTRDGKPTPSLTAGPEEMLGIAAALGEGGRGVFEMVADFADLEGEFALLREMVKVSGLPMSITVAQSDAAPGQWRRLLDLIAEAVAEGLPMRAQVPPRAIGIMLGLQASLNPFGGHPTFRQEVADLPHAEQLEKLRDPGVRARILAEKAPDTLQGLLGGFDRLFELGSPPEYEPAPEASLQARAEALGVEASALAYDLMLGEEGTALLYRPFLNYTGFDLDVSRQMLLDPNSVPGLSDAGAHCGMICDGSFPTFLLSHWGKDRSRGEKIPMEDLVKMQSADTAALMGLGDRGRVAPGLRADLNLIDWEMLGLGSPEMVFDLPTGGKRLIQKALGYRQTLVAGQTICADGELTGELPGRLVRGARPAP